MAAAAYATASDRIMVRRIQSGLAQLGSNPGPTDGILGGETRGAIRAYQQDHRLLVDGVPTTELAAHLESRVEGY